VERRRARGNRREDVRGEVWSTDERAAEKPAEGETESVGGPVGPKRAATTAAFVVVETNWRSQEAKHANPLLPSLSLHQQYPCPISNDRKTSCEEKEKEREFGEMYP